ncbi:hypothetical protein [Halomarina ordinaria]|uniref:DUF8173 domain-containing protein n=1 Tax=Halomarina ordinaria TaxID=3033939 RepID=A0ABD5U8S9_9EURY|nr:hypothetical protein [Halomarina sp. PSRA2]
MSSRSPARPRRHRIVASLLLVPLFAAPAAAQRPFDTGTTVGVEAAVASLVALVVGGGLLAFAPTYTGRTTRRITEDPGETFVYGVGLGVAVVVLVVVLVLTVVGSLLVIPLAVVVAVAGTLGYLAAGRVVTDSRPLVLLVAVFLAVAVAVVPLLGGLLGFVLSSLGMGAAYLDYRDDGASTGDGTPGG